MTIRIEAIYENGVLRPLEPLDLPENERVTLLVSPVSEEVGLDTEYLSYCRAEADHTVSLEEVRAALSGIKGSLTADFIEEREDR